MFFSFLYFLLYFYIQLYSFTLQTNTFGFFPPQSCNIKSLHTGSNWWLSFTWAQPGIWSGISSGISNTLNTIKYYSVVEWARLANQNQPNSPKTDETPPSQLVLGASSSKHSQHLLNTVMAFFCLFLNSFSHRFIFITGLFPSTATKLGRGPQSVQPATKSTVFPERTKRKSSDGRGGRHTRLVIRAKSFRDAVADSSLCFCLGPLFDMGGGGVGGNQMDSQAVWQTDKHSPPGSDPYPLNTLDASASFRAKGSPDPCCFSQFWAPPPHFFIRTALLLWQAHTQCHVHRELWWKDGGLIWKWIKKGSRWTEVLRWQNRHFVPLTNVREE